MVVFESWSCADLVLVGLCGNPGCVVTLVVSQPQIMQLCANPRYCPLLLN
jgi:hypothetical protein